MNGHRSLTRRQFAQILGLMAGAMALGGCKEDQTTDPTYAENANQTEVVEDNTVVPITDSDDVEHAADEFPNLEGLFRLSADGQSARACSNALLAYDQVNVRLPEPHSTTWSDGLVRRVRGVDEEYEVLWGVTPDEVTRIDRSAGEALVVMGDDLSVFDTVDVRPIVETACFDAFTSWPSSSSIRVDEIQGEDVHLMDIIDFNTEHEAEGLLMAGGPYSTPGTSGDAPNFLLAKEPMTVTYGSYEGTSFVEETVDLRDPCLVAQSSYGWHALEGTYAPSELAVTKTKNGYFPIDVSGLAPGTYTCSIQDYADGTPLRVDDSGSAHFVFEIA